jgi:hypothetical protein
MILWMVITILEGFSFFFFFLFILQCRPSPYFWTQYTGGEGTCINPDLLVAITYTYSAIACLTDWLYAIMPAFILWNLKMDTRTKVSVGVLMALGARYVFADLCHDLVVKKVDLRLTPSSASITTVIRIPYLKTFRDTADFLYATTDVALWTTAELGIGISAASLATLRPLLRQIRGESPLAFSERTGSGSGSFGGKSHLTSLGYVRSESRGGLEEYGLKHHVKVHVKSVTSSENTTDSEQSRDVGIQSIASLQYPAERDMIWCAIGSVSEEHLLKQEKLKPSVYIRD